MKGDSIATFDLKRGRLAGSNPAPAIDPPPQDSGAAVNIEVLRSRLSKADIQAHITELSERGTFLVYFEQGSFHPEESPEALSEIDGVISIEQKAPENPYIYRLTVTTGAT
jgi:hypothetical protein